MCQYQLGLILLACIQSSYSETNDSNNDIIGKVGILSEKTNNNFDNNNNHHNRHLLARDIDGTSMYECPSLCSEPCSDLSNCQATSNGQCSQCSNGYFRPNPNKYSCTSCSDTFGEGCLQCSDYMGCQQCKQGYKLYKDSDYCEGIQFCIQDSVSFPEGGAMVTTTDPNFPANGCPLQCQNDPCTCSEIANCIACHSNGCNQCESGYFKQDFNYHCVSCDEMYGDRCTQCGDFHGCERCADGYKLIRNNQGSICGSLWYCCDEAINVNSAVVTSIDPTNPPSFDVTCLENVKFVFGRHSVNGFPIGYSTEDVSTVIYVNSQGYLTIQCNSNSESETCIYYPSSTIYDFTSQNNPYDAPHSDGWSECDNNNSNQYTIDLDFSDCPEPPLVPACNDDCIIIYDAEYDDISPTSIITQDIIDFIPGRYCLHTPTVSPSNAPTLSPVLPTPLPSNPPTFPSSAPSLSPTMSPSIAPTGMPTLTAFCEINENTGIVLVIDDGCAVLNDTNVCNERNEFISELIQRINVVNINIALVLYNMNSQVLFSFNTAQSTMLSLILNQECNYAPGDSNLESGFIAAIDLFENGGIIFDDRIIVALQFCAENGGSNVCSIDNQNDIIANDIDILPVTVATLGLDSIFNCFINVLNGPFIPDVNNIATSNNVANVAAPLCGEINPDIECDLPEESQIMLVIDDGCVNYNIAECSARNSFLAQLVAEIYDQSVLSIGIMTYTDTQNILLTLDISNIFDALIVLNSLPCNNAGLLDMELAIATAAGQLINANSGEKKIILVSYCEETLGNVCNTAATLSNNGIEVIGILNTPIPEPLDISCIISDSGNIFELDIDNVPSGTVDTIANEICSTPTPSPTPARTNDPTPSPTNNPTPSPTADPTPSPTNMPTPSPTAEPTPSPTNVPTPAPTNDPTPSPTNNPTPSPTDHPTPSPIDDATPSPTDMPTPSPTNDPTPTPTDHPTSSPTNIPTPSPTNIPTPSPTNDPTPSPTSIPTPSPTNMPTPSPSDHPTPSPTNMPTPAPTDYPVSTPDGGVCKVWGDPHFRTWDLITIDFMGNGSYIYVESCDKDLSIVPFIIAGEHSSIGDAAWCEHPYLLLYDSNSNLKHILKLFGEYDGTTYNNYLTIASSATSINLNTLTESDFILFPTSDYLISQIYDTNYYFRVSGQNKNLVIEANFGNKGFFRIEWRQHTLRIEISSDFFSNDPILCGLCGSFDSDSNNDLHIFNEATEEYDIFLENTWDNAHLFGDQFCFEDLISISDTSEVDQCYASTSIQAPSEECINGMLTYCEQLLEDDCPDCESDLNEDNWINSCQIDACLVFSNNIPNTYSEFKEGNFINSLLSQCDASCIPCQEQAIVFLVDHGCSIFTDDVNECDVRNNFVDSMAQAYYSDIMSIHMGVATYAQKNAGNVKFELDHSGLSGVRDAIEDIGCKSVGNLDIDSGVTVVIDDIDNNEPINGWDAATIIMISYCQGGASTDLCTGGTLKTELDNRGIKVISIEDSNGDADNSCIADVTFNIDISNPPSDILSQIYSELPTCVDGNRRRRRRRRQLSNNNDNNNNNNWVNPLLLQQKRRQLLNLNEFDYNYVIYKKISTNGELTGEIGIDIEGQVILNIVDTTIDESILYGIYEDGDIDINNLCVNNTFPGMNSNFVFYDHSDPAISVNAIVDIGYQNCDNIGGNCIDPFCSPSC